MPADTIPPVAASVDDLATARWIDGDRSGALSEAFAETRLSMYEIARRVAGHDHVADVIQNVLMRVWTHQDRFDPKRSPLSQYLRLLTRGDGDRFRSHWGRPPRP